MFIIIVVFLLESVSLETTLRQFFAPDLEVFEVYNHNSKFGNETRVQI